MSLGTYYHAYMLDYYKKLALQALRHTSKEVCQNGSTGLVVLPTAGQPPGGAAHEQRGRAGALPAQRLAGQVLLPGAVPAVHEQAALPEGL